MRLRVSTSPDWAAAVLADFDAFLRDHAANERKASAAALALVAHYPDRTELVARCIEVSIEELTHFQAVCARIAERGLVLLPDTRSEYLRRLGGQFRDGREAYFLDRLLVAGIVEARGCERFGILAAALPEGPMRDFYRDLARSEVRHQELYLDLAREYFAPTEIDARMDELLAAEAGILAALPIRAALY